MTSFQKSEVTTYIPEQETITLWFVRKQTEMIDGVDTEVDVPLFWADVRADITFAERERLQAAISERAKPFEADLLEKNSKRPKADRVDEALIRRRAQSMVTVNSLWDHIAPYVVAWSVGTVEDGKPVLVDPPSVAGGQQFALISEEFTTRIFNHLWNQSHGDIDMDFLGRLKPTVKPSETGNTAAMKDSR